LALTKGNIAKAIGLEGVDPLDLISLRITRLEPR